MRITLNFHSAGLRYLSVMASKEQWNLMSPDLIILDRGPAQMAAEKALSLMEDLRYELDKRTLRAAPKGTGALVNSYDSFVSREGDRFTIEASYGMDPSDVNPYTGTPVHDYAWPVHWGVFHHRKDGGITLSGGSQFLDKPLAAIFKQLQWRLRNAK